VDKCVCGKSGHESVKCPQCDGKGLKDGGFAVGKYKCKHCHGTGRVCPRG
jgi:transposase-like protein